MSVVYSCINNIGYEYQSKRNEIAFLAIGKNNEVNSCTGHKMASRRTFFEEVKRQIREVNTNPIVLKNKKGVSFKIDVEVCSINADNLAVNSLLGLPESFAQTQCCQYCTIKFTSFDVEIYPRLPQNLDHIFNDIPYSGMLYVADLFHDLHEGKFNFFLAICKFNPFLNIFLINRHNT